MKHEEASQQTRRALSAALKAQMEHKPLRKITVNDLIQEYGLNRKTFYYHYISQVMFSSLPVVLRQSNSL